MVNRGLQNLEADRATGKPVVPKLGTSNTGLVCFIGLALVALTTTSTFGQIELSYTPAKSLVGATSARVVGERILIGNDSKPQVVDVAIIKVSCLEKVRIKARRSLYETVELTPLSSEEYLLVGNGEYLIEAISVSWDRSLRVTIDGEETPKPDPIPNPPKPDEPVTPGSIEATVKQVLPTQAKGFTEVFNEAAAKVEAKAIKSDRELLDFVKPATTKARQEANKPFDIMLEQSLPNGSFAGKEIEVSALLKRIAKSWKN